MKKTYSESQLTEMYFMRDWCNFICNFIAECGHKSFEDMQVDVDENYQKGYFEGFREGFVDINESAKDLPRHEFIELNKRLKEKFGKTLADFDKKKEKKISAVLKRGNVRNEDEFRLVQDYIENIWDNPLKKNEFETLQRLNYKFEQSFV